MNAEQLRRQLRELEVYARNSAFPEGNPHSKGADFALRSVANTLSQLAARLSGMAAGWQPIETAPKGGRWILVWRKHGVMPRIVRFDPDFEEFEDEDGIHIYHLTHWMPLPEPPK